MDIFLIILPIFVVIFLGTFLKSINLIDDSFISGANKLVYYVCLPVLLFDKISSSNIMDMKYLTAVWIIAISVSIVFAASLVNGKWLKWSNSFTGTFIMNNFRGNFAYLGLPVSFYILGEPGLTTGSVLMAFLVPFVNILAVLSMSFNGTTSFSFRYFVKQNVSNPLFIGCMLGICGSLLSLKLPVPADRTVSIISGITLPLALICIGASIQFRDMKHNAKPLMLSSAYKLLIMPMIGLFLATMIFKVDKTITTVLVIMLASPTALINYVLAHSMGGDSQLATNTIITTTVLSMLTYVFWLNII